LEKIKTVYVCNHTHTDIGFTDYQDVCFRQHARFIGEEEGWVARRLQNLSRGKSRPTIAFARPPKEARRSDPIEHPGEAMALSGQKLAVDLDPLGISTVLVKFAP
jgi:hypothetical protein